MPPALAARRLPVAAVVLFATLAGFSLLTRPGAAVSRAGAAAGSTVEVVVTSADLSQALTRMPDLTLSSIDPGGPIVHVNESASFQRIRGFGGALTDTSAWLIGDQLSASTRSTLMNALFAPSGIDLGFLRLPMGASDFTAARRPFSYDDLPRGRADPRLARFSIAHDTRYAIPALAQARAINPGLFVLANPWSPPGWMKTNEALSNRNDTGDLKPSSLGPLAHYFVRFLQAYAALGIHVDAVTPQNEPGQASIYPGMNMGEATEAAFVRDDLVPALRAAKLDTRVYGYDWGWSGPQMRFASALARSRAAASLAGISTHCYRGDPTAISALHAEAPRLEEIVAECSPGIMPASTSEVAIGSMRNWASALALWNLALDPSGGPVQPPNLACPRCTAIVTVDEATHQVTFTRDYYQLGQVSKFVLPGAVRIGSNHFVSYVHPTKHRAMATPGLDDVAFQNPDGSRVLVAYNGSRAPIAFGVKDDAQYFSYTLAARATGTFVWNQPAP
ncbi:MAG TPA: glycoside hydrolase family 30 beta sandwich domain-containing protein [Solirubrobacteraceae bacterium]|nr:glycoside hydrolase family 30 beta sandwich domain-containing protein [Solirubrobacteraceae bacterium]